MVEIDSAKDLVPTTGPEDDVVIELKQHTAEEIAASGKWYDRRLVKGLPQYSNATIQIVIMSFVLFLTSGCFNAITGIGNSGISKASVADNANVALYLTFATLGMVGGVCCNYFGHRNLMMFGGTGYFVYTASLLCFHYTENAGFCIFAGAYLGICAAMLWAAQGSVIMSYPLESRKGRDVSLSWVIFNFGSVIGSLIPLAQNINSGESKVNAGTYVAFMALMGFGVVLASFLLPMDKVYKSDGTRVMAKKYPKLKDELWGLYRLLTRYPKIYYMVPMFASSNWFYTYQFNDYNAGRFNIRTRSLNSLLYWLSQMWGAVLIGFVLDFKKFKRSTRARIGWTIIFLTGMAVWGGGLKFQIGYTRENVKDFKPLDFKDSAYIGPMFLYMFYGMFDAIFQTFIFWTLGTLSNNPKKVALFASCYKSFQSAFAAIVWRLDALEVSYMALFASSWGMIQASLLIAAPLILFQITDHTDLQEDGIAELVDRSELTSVKSYVDGNLEAKDV